MSNRIDFFLGANTSDGFFGYYNETVVPNKNNKTYIIKGGPGTGKSNLMKKISKSLSPKHEIIEHIHCSSDPDSLDAVIFNNMQFSVFDGTAPHIIDPEYPGAYETIINLGDYWDEKNLSNNRHEIINASNLIKENHLECQKYIKTANILLNNNYKISLACTNMKKIKKFVSSFIKKEFPQKNTAKAKCDEKIENKRLLSAVTNKGIINYADTLGDLCDKIYIIRDEYGASSDLILKSLREYAQNENIQFYSCWCSLNPKTKLEHLFFPKQNLCIITENRFFKTKINNYKVVNYTRFTDMDLLKSKKQKLNFNKKAAEELLFEATVELKDAKQTHDILESYYINSMDFNLIDKKANEIIDKLL